MTILVTGSKGFIGRNLIAHLKQNGYTDILEYDFDTAHHLLDDFAARSEFVFHLAGVNRPKDPAEFMRGNADFTKVLLESLERHGNKAPVLISSSIQAAFDNPYGLSKKAEEACTFAFAVRTGVPVFVFRLPNVFGKWSRPNYNSAIATFCHNISREMPISVNDREAVLELVYIDDVVEEFIHVLRGKARYEGSFCILSPSYTVKLGRIIDLLYSFHAVRENLEQPDFSDAFTGKLYSTYLSYMPEDGFSYPLKSHKDNRGSFTEFLRLSVGGQVSINITKPGILKGNHWHHSKCEKFLTVSGNGIVRFRAPDDEQVMEYKVSGDDLRVIDVPPGYAHNFENSGTSDLVTVIWANECFNLEKPDTFILEV